MLSVFLVFIIVRGSLFRWYHHSKTAVVNVERHCRQRRANNVRTYFLIRLLGCHLSPQNRRQTGDYYSSFLLTPGSFLTVPYHPQALSFPPPLGGGPSIQIALTASSWLLFFIVVLFTLSSLSWIPSGSFFLVTCTESLYNTCICVFAYYFCLYNLIDEHLGHQVLACVRTMVVWKDTWRSELYRRGIEKVRGRNRCAIIPLFSV